MSKRVIFTCTVLLLIGLGGTWNVLNGLPRGHISFNVAALFLPVSVLLFLGIPGARTIASIVFAICYVVLAFFLVAPLIAAGSITPRVFGSQLQMSGAYPVLVVFVAMFGAILMLLHWMLYSQPFDEHLA